MVSLKFKVLKVFHPKEIFIFILLSRRQFEIRRAVAGEKVGDMLSLDCDI